MPKPLTITSTTNAHALAVYGALSILGGFCTFTSPPRSMLATMPDGVATVLMGMMMFGGITAFGASILSSRRADPTMGMLVEITALAFVIVALVALLVSLLSVYGLTAIPSSVVLTGSVLAGSIGRIVQASRERNRLIQARRSRDRRTVEVTAAPEQR